MPVCTACIEGWPFYGLVVGDPRIARACTVADSSRFVGPGQCIEFGQRLDVFGGMSAVTAVAVTYGSAWLACSVRGVSRIRWNGVRTQLGSLGWQCKIVVCIRTRGSFVVRAIPCG